MTFLVQSHTFLLAEMSKKLSLLPIFSLFPFSFNFISTDKLFKRIRLSIAVSFLKFTTSQEPTTKRDETRQTLQKLLYTHIFYLPTFKIDNAFKSKLFVVKRTVKIVITHLYIRRITAFNNIKASINKMNFQCRFIIQAPFSIAGWIK